ncbi:MAG: hypothetical protein H0Z30_04875 [Candidatus Marinimicrobia bacterium]|nr:hypothetical protein [Candidatus Neomarinimicrobiota bacterium]MCD6099923.1 hypothetical protein [Candidatus Neomarinimicrobiota bacterium]
MNTKSKGQEIEPINSTITRRSPQANDETSSKRQVWTADSMSRSLAERVTPSNNRR